MLPQNIPVDKRRIPLYIYLPIFLRIFINISVFRHTSFTFPHYNDPIN